MTQLTRRAPIGVFDSGVGGLSILGQIRHQLPNEDLIYFADQAHVPYGPRPMTEVRLLAVGITQFLLDLGAKAIVVACNTASAAGLQHLRASFPQVPFVGMEPAVKPAAEVTQSGHVGVLATPATFEGELFASVIARFATGVEVHQRTVPGLVERIEQGDLTGPDTRHLLSRALQPMLAAGIDTLVLGCTHYPFVIPTIAELVGPQVKVIDPAPAVARQTLSLLAQHGLANADGVAGTTVFLTSGDPDRLAKLVPRLIDEPGQTLAAGWADGRLALIASP